MNRHIESALIAFGAMILGAGNYKATTTMDGDAIVSFMLFTGLWMMAMGVKGIKVG